MMSKRLNNIKFPAMVAVAVISFYAFVFLNTVQTGSVSVQQIGLKPTSVEVEDTGEKEQSRKFKSDYFPDISAVKRAVELMRKFIPAS